MTPSISTKSICTDMSLTFIWGTIHWQAQTAMLVYTLQSSDQNILRPTFATLTKYVALSSLSHFATVYSYRKIHGHRISCLNLLPRTVISTTLSTIFFALILRGICVFYKPKGSTKEQRTSNAKLFLSLFFVSSWLTSALAVQFFKD